MRLPAVEILPVRVHERVAGDTVSENERSEMSKCQHVWGVRYSIPTPSHEEMGYGDDVYFACAHCNKELTLEQAIRRLNDAAALRLRCEAEHKQVVAVRANNRDLSDSLASEHSERVEWQRRRVRR